MARHRRRIRAHAEHDIVRAEVDRLGMAVDLLPPFLDPRWGLERMIAALAKVDERHAGPLPRY